MTQGHLVGLDQGYAQGLALDWHYVANAGHFVERAAVEAGKVDDLGCPLFSRGSTCPAKMLLKPAPLVQAQTRGMLSIRATALSLFLPGTMVNLA